jgi:murein DD-endopeptidase MepM/ murein hydrolase activator NlpD
MKINFRSRLPLATAALLTAALLAPFQAWAGPPLICERIDIGGAKSLPWQITSGWQGADPSYNLTRLSEDTLAILAPATTLKVRMETLRRAALYAAKEPRLVNELTARLTARALDAEAAGKSDAMAWFDAGYFVETVRQATFVYRYDMLSPQERTAWKLRGGVYQLDGYAWVQKAIRLGGKNMDPVLARIEGYRNADLRAREQTKVAAR